jgi:hypothetical protein
MLEKIWLDSQHSTNYLSNYDINNDTNGNDDVNNDIFIKVRGRMQSKHESCSIK